MSAQDERWMSYAEWLEANPCPDLQALADRYGGLGRVPPAEWARYDAAMAEWQARRKARTSHGAARWITGNKAATR